VKGVELADNYQKRNDNTTKNKKNEAATTFP